MKRHGDLSFHKVERASGQKVQHDGAYVLAVGEHTTHKHVITKKSGTLELRKDKDGSLYIILDGRAVITHEEHKPIELTTGTYVMRHEREMDYFLNEVVRVQD